MNQRSAIELIRADALVFAKFRNTRLVSELVMASSRAWKKHSSKSGQVSTKSIMNAPWMWFEDGGCIPGIELSLETVTNSLLQSRSSMPSSFTHSIEIAEHHLQLNVTLQIQRKLKHSDLWVDWHFILWCIAKSMIQEWSQNNYYGFPKGFVRVALLRASFCCPLCHWVASKSYRLCTTLRISSKLRSTTRILTFITSGKIQTIVRLIWFARGVGQVRYFWRLQSCDAYLHSLKLIEDKFYVIINEFWHVTWDICIFSDQLYPTNTFRMVDKSMLVNEMCTYVPEENISSSERCVR